MDTFTHSRLIALLLLSVFDFVRSAFDPTCTVQSGNLKFSSCQANMKDTSIYLEITWQKYDVGQLLGDMYLLQNGQGKESIYVIDINVPSKVNWWNFAPYVYISEGTQTQSSLQLNGTFKEIIERAIRKCCGECVQFTYLQPATNSEILRSRIGTNGSVISFPFYGSATTTKYETYPFFPIIESPGIILIQKVAESGKSAEELLGAVFTGWPVLVLTLIMAALSGIIMWALDTYWNPEEFPRSFFKGAWEGFWWAFVSMTTVGYGDKAPRSLIGRVFAFFWVLIGLVIISIFTATITTALTAVSLSNDITLFGKIIVALNHTEEQKYGVRKNAKVVPVANIQDFINNITKTPENGSTQADGGLIDSYVAGFEKDKLSEENGVKVSTVFEHQFMYGFIVSNELHDTKIAKCIRRQLSTDESYIVEKIQQTMKALPEPKKSAAEEKSGNMFDASSTIFQTCIFVCLGIIIFLTLCGLVWEYCYWRPRLAKQGKKGDDTERVMSSHTSYEELVATQCQELDDVMIAEVMGFYKVFNKKMEEIRKLHLQHQPVAEVVPEKDNKMLFDDNVNEIPDEQSGYEKPE